MKSFTVAMQNLLASGATTLSWGWQITTTTGTNYYYTNADQDQTISGHTYLSTPGFKNTAMSFTEGLSSDDIDLEGLIDASHITVLDILFGKYRKAAVTLFFFNRVDLTMGTPTMMYGTIGSIDKDRNRWIFHIQGMRKRFSQNYGEVTSPGCRAVFGDSRCNFNLAGVTNTGTVLTVTDNRTFTTSLAHGAGYYALGFLTWTSGANNGQQMEVKSWDGTTVTLQLTMNSTIAPGDTFSITKGCNKIFGDGTNGCLSVSNQVNFIGEPSLPGLDAITKSASFIGYQ